MRLVWRVMPNDLSIYRAPTYVETKNGVWPASAAQAADWPRPHGRSLGQPVLWR